MGNLINSYDYILLISLSEVLEQNIKKIAIKPDSIFRIPPRPTVDHRIHASQFILKQVQSISPFQRLMIPNPQNGFNSQNKKSCQKIFIHPGSGSHRKNWLIDRFIQLSQELILLGWQIEWILGPSDTHLQSHLVGKGKLHLLSEIIDVVHLFQSQPVLIGNDSGLSHLASYMGCPTLSIFGPSDPIRWHPIGPCYRVITSKHVSCSPCFEKTIHNCDNNDCLTTISVHDVLNDFISLITTKE